MHKSGMYTGSYETYPYKAWLFPNVHSTTDIHYMDRMSYKAIVHVFHVNESRCRAKDYIVEVWTNQIDEFCQTGEWHAVRLRYCETQEYCVTYLNDFVITGDKDFEFTFRAKGPDATDYTWMRPFEENGVVNVAKGICERRYLSGDDFYKFSDTIMCVNSFIGERAASGGYTHALAVGEDCCRCPGDTFPRTKLDIKQYAQNPIASECILQGVSWLQKADKPGNKIMVYCKPVQGRGACILAAYLYATHSDWSFEQCWAHVREKIPVAFVHRDFERTVTNLYPRHDNKA